MATMSRILLLLLALTAALPATAQRLVIKGSDTLGAKLVPQLAEEYRARFPAVAFEIAAEGSATGIAAITDGTADIGMSSRKAKPTELSVAQARGIALRETVVAYDGLAVIVHRDNPIAGLTRRQVERIFTGAVTDWAAVGGRPGRISIYIRSTSSGTYSDWMDLAMRRHDYAPSSQKMAGNEQIAAEVARNPRGIGYIGLAYLGAEGIRAVPIDGTLPDEEAVRSRRYPYARPNFLYTKGEPTGEAARFLTFVLSPEGQRIVRAVGFVRVR
jgi:phosphate transport system substrate-binding protein